MLSSHFKKTQFNDLPLEVKCAIVHAVVTVDDLAALCVVNRQLNKITNDAVTIKNTFFKPSVSVDITSYKKRELVLSHYDALQERWQKRHPMHQTICELYKRVETITTLGATIFEKKRENTLAVARNHVHAFKNTVDPSFLETRLAIDALLEILNDDTCIKAKQKISKALDKIKAEYLLCHIAVLRTPSLFMQAIHDVKAIIVSDNLFTLALNHAWDSINIMFDIAQPYLDKLICHILKHPDFQNKIIKEYKKRLQYESSGFFHRLERRVMRSESSICFLLQSPICLGLRSILYQFNNSWLCEMAIQYQQVARHVLVEPLFLKYVTYFQLESIIAAHDDSFKSVLSNDQDARFDLLIFIDHVNHGEREANLTISKLFDTCESLYRSDKSVSIFLQQQGYRSSTRFLSHVLKKLSSHILSETSVETSGEKMQIACYQVGDLSKIQLERLTSPLYQQLVLDKRWTLAQMLHTAYTVSNDVDCGQVAQLTYQNNEMRSKRPS